MSRRKIIKKRFPKPDPVYNNYLVSILVSRLIKDGKKTLAQNIVCDALDIIAYKTESDPIEVFEQAVKNVTPLVEVKARRFGGATYQVPMEVTSFRGTNLALRWIVKASRSRTGKTIALKLAAELMDASKNSGDAMRKKQDTHKMAEANKAFAHYRY
tara:strand:- start:60 stop:530 length:471 start_codon:yes stop_codon:yes gene_type:complete